MKPTDPIQITQLPHGTKLQKGDVWTFLSFTEAEPATRAYAQSITLARMVFGPRWRSVSGPNLSEEEFEFLLHRIVFEWLYTYAISKRPLVVTLDDLSHPYAWRRVRAAVNMALGSGTSGANRLVTRLLDISLDAYTDWLEQETKMEELR